MAEVKRKRGRPQKPKVENHYKVLGIRANATPDTVKQAYVQMVKQNPPEQHPEQFQRIRRAYETLRDSAKRAEYDFSRKYGGSVEKLAEQAMEAMEEEKWALAEKLFHQILTVSPSAIGARIGLAQVHLSQADLPGFERQMELLIETADNREEQSAALALKAKLLLESDYNQETIQVLDRLQLEHPELASSTLPLRVAAYMGMERFGEAWNLMIARVPSSDSYRPDDLGFFITWMNLMCQLEKWQFWSKIQQSFRKFLKSLEDPEDVSFAVGTLMEEHMGYWEAGMYREAELFIDLAYYIDPTNRNIQALRRESQEIAKISKELDRMMKDGSVFPLVSMHALQWFFEETGNDEVSEAFEGIPLSLRREMEAMPEEFAAGIKRLQKKYPLLYQRYKERWDQLYAEQAAGLNRESRRRIR